MDVYQAFNLSLVRTQSFFSISAGELSCWRKNHLLLHVELIRRINRLHHSPLKQGILLQTGGEIDH